MRLQLRLFAFLIPLVLWGCAPSALADSVYISNDVHVSASTGGTTDANVVTGGASVDVRIQGRVNGVPIPGVEIATTSPSGSASVEVRNDFSASSSSTDVRVRFGAAAADTLPFGSSVLPRGLRNLRRHAGEPAAITSSVPAPPFPSSSTPTSTPPRGNLLRDIPRFAEDLFHSLWNRLYGIIFHF